MNRLATSMNGVSTRGVELVQERRLGMGEWLQASEAGGFGTLLHTSTGTNEM